MEECICCEYDGKGWSTCGFKCPVHPPDGLCPICKTKNTHLNVICISCDFDYYSDIDSWGEDSWA